MYNYESVDFFHAIIMIIYIMNIYIYNHRIYNDFCLYYLI